MINYGIRFFAERNPCAGAIVDARGRVWTRGELLDSIHRTANAFVARGLEPGDVIAVVAPNCGELLAVHLAGIAAGLYVVPVNWHLAQPEITHVLDNSRAKAVIAHARLGALRLESLAKACGPVRALVVVEAAQGYVSFEDFVAGQPATAPARKPGRVLPYTGATMGLPKAVRRPLGEARASLERIVAWHRSLGIALEDDNVHLCSSMLYHAAPLEGAVIALEMGHTVALMDAWDAEAFLRVIDTRRVTTAFMVPTMFVRLLKLSQETRRRYSTASLRFVIHGAAPCAPDVKRRMLDWWGPIIWESYGATEVQGVIASPAEWLRYPGTVGRPIAGSRLKILADDGRELPPGEIGSIYLTPHTRDRFEYLGDPAKTRACHRGEFVTVGDRGHVNDAGYLFLAGRASELIISSGMNIYPAEIEHVLLEHPAVTDCAVVGAAHELCGEVPVAHVELAPSFAPSAELTSSLLAYVGERLSPMKLPRRIEYAQRLPRDPNGKLLRRLLCTQGERHGR